MRSWYKTSQSDYDELPEYNEGLFATDPYLQSLIGDAAKDIIGATITQVSTTSCETIYDVDGIKVRLWVITGGTPAIAMHDHSFSQRFPIKDERWTNAHWENARCTFEHQDPENPQGPTYDILPEGKKTIVDYVKHNASLQGLGQSRYDRLPIKGEFKGKWTHATITPFRLYMVINYRSDITKLHPSWVAFHNFLQSLGDRRAMHELSEEEYQRLVSILNEMISKKAVRQ